MSKALAALALAAALGFAAAWQVQAWRQDAADLARAEDAAETERLRARVADAASSGHESDRVQIRTEFQIIEKEVERVVEKPVYRNVCLDADGLRLLAGAIAGRPAAGKPADAVPGSEAAR